MADLEIEEEAVLELLRDDEELLAVVPGLRSRPDDGEQQVLVVVTERRVLVVGQARDDVLGLRIVDVTQCSTQAPRTERRLVHDGGHLTLDVDDESIARMWAHIDRATGSGGHLPT